MTSLTDLTVLEAVSALQTGQVSSRELTIACLERIEHLEPSLHAFITFVPDLALSLAEAADRTLVEWRRSPKGQLPALLGVPIAVKDVLTLENVRCTCGSRILENFVPPYTATAVEKLLAAGVVVVGKTNTDEFAMGSSTENSAYGPTHNPWDLQRVPGGSSGGSAAAVAARLVPAAPWTVWAPWAARQPTWQPYSRLWPVTTAEMPPPWICPCQRSSSPQKPVSKACASAFPRNISSQASSPRLKALFARPLSR